MKRRGFLSLLATVASGATLDPERLLWVPGAKLVSIPAVTRLVIYDPMRAYQRVDDDLRRLLYVLHYEPWPHVDVAMTRELRDNWIMTGVVRGNLL